MPVDPAPETGPAPDAAPAREQPARREKRRALVIGVVLLVVVAIVAVGAVLLLPGDDEGYDETVEENFIAACTADGGDDVAPVCECLYAGIVDTVPYDRFEEVNDSFEAELAADPDAEVRLPGDLDEIRAECVEDEGVPVTTVPPTREGTDGGPDLTTPIPGDTATDGTGADDSGPSDSAPDGTIISPVTTA